MTSAVRGRDIRVWSQVVWLLYASPVGAPISSITMCKVMMLHWSASVLSWFHNPVHCSREQHQLRLRDPSGAPSCPQCAEPTQIGHGLYYTYRHAKVRILSPLRLVMVFGMSLAACCACLDCCGQVGFLSSTHSSDMSTANCIPAVITILTMMGSTGTLLPDDIPPYSAAVLVPRK